MVFADIHCHALWNVDDGAKDKEHMLQMVDAAYDDGVRLLCLTPHYHPGYFGNNCEKTVEVFAQLQAYAAQKHPDLKLYLANELRYDSNCISWLREGLCRTIGDNCVLVDFSGGESSRNITAAMYRLLNAGYLPILAHVERYVHLRSDIQTIRQLRRQGVLVQITAGALFGNFGLRAKIHSRRLVRKRLVDLVASDAHDMSKRCPGLSDAYDYLQDKHGADYAQLLCGKMAYLLLAEGAEEREE